MEVGQFSIEHRSGVGWGYQRLQQSNGDATSLISKNLSRYKKRLSVTRINFHAHGLVFHP